MRLLDSDNNKALRNVSLYLTVEEAEEMIGYLEQIIEYYQDHSHGHAHVNDKDYKHEVTLVLYNENNIDSFDEFSKKLIKEDI